MKWLEKNYKFSLALAIIISIIIFYMSSLQGKITENLGPSFPLKPIIYHFTIFFLLSFFLEIFLVRGKPNRAKLIIVASLISIFYAATDEFHQLFVPGRFCSFEDLIIDTAGILLAAGIYWLRVRR